MISGYITTSEFFSSNFLCAFSQCCAISGEILSGCITSLIDIASSMIDNYLGHSLWETEYREIINGNDSSNYHTMHIPVTSISGFTYENKMNYTNVYNFSTSVSSTGTVDYYTLVDDKTGWIEIYNGFERSKRYRLHYTAGYSTIPEDIKTACKMLVAQMSIQIDTGNLSNPDISHDSVKLDNITFTYGASKMIKQITTKDIRDLNYLPFVVERILMKYKYDKCLVS